MRKEVVPGQIITKILSLSNADYFRDCDITLDIECIIEKGKFCATHKLTV